MIEPNRKLASAPFSRKPATLLLNLLLLAGSTLAGLGLAEIGFRILSPMPRFGPYFDLRPYKKLQLFPHLPGVSSPAWHTSNQWGLRGDDPPRGWRDYYTIITIGGSTTQCFYLDDKKTWPYRLQEKLKETQGKVWVGNAGLDGHSTRGHLLMMQKIISQIRPNAVILLVGANDLSLSLMENYTGGGNKYDQQWIEQFDSPQYWLWEHSRFLQVLYVWKRILVDESKVVTKAGPRAYLPEKLSTPEQVPAKLKDMLTSLPSFQNNVIEMIHLAKKLKVRVIFLTQPSLYEDTPYWAGILATNYWVKEQTHPLSAATRWKLLSIFNQELLRLCTEQKVECLDLAARIPHTFENFYDPYHFTDQGAERVASEVAAFLDAHPGYSRPGHPLPDQDRLKNAGSPQP